MSRPSPWAEDDGWLKTHFTEWLESDSGLPLSMWERTRRLVFAFVKAHPGVVDYASWEEIADLAERAERAARHPYPRSGHPHRRGGLTAMAKQARVPLTSEELKILEEAEIAAKDQVIERAQALRQAYDHGVDSLSGNFAGDLFDALDQLKEAHERYG